MRILLDCFVRYLQLINPNRYDYIGGGHGIGDLLGSWTGNYAGNFDSRWAASYECYSVKKRATTDQDPAQTRDMPCGYVKTSSNRTYLMNEGIKGHMMDFTDDGATYNSVSYHVNTYCECRFYGYVEPDHFLRALTDKLA